MAWKVTIAAVHLQREHPLVYMVFPSQIEAYGYVKMWRKLATQADSEIRIREENFNAACMAVYEPFGSRSADKTFEPQRAEDRRRDR